MLEPENITYEERQIIEELRKRIEHELPPSCIEDKSLYYRFLKARDFNLKNAESLLRRHIASRKYFQIDEIVKKYDAPENIFKYMPDNHIGYDKEGSPIRYDNFGEIDYKGILSLYTRKQIFQHVIYKLENDIKKMTEQSKKRGKSITKYVCIYDMDKINLFCVTNKKVLDTFIEGFLAYQDNYPERLKSLYVINASRYFNIVYAILKPFLASAVIQKINVFGRDGWKEALLEIADADQLPVFLGGSRTDPDGNPFCPSIVTHAIPVPEELYLKKKKITLADKNDVKTLNVPRFSSSEIIVQVDEQNTVIEWEFEIKNKDIGFGLYYRDTSLKNENLEELIPRQRVDTTFLSEKGIYKCDRVGTYIIVFDNTYSWIFSKEVYYKLCLTKPTPENYHTD